MRLREAWPIQVALFLQRSPVPLGRVTAPDGGPGISPARRAVFWPPDGSAHGGELAGVPTNALNRLFVRFVAQMPPDETFPQAVRQELSRPRRYWPGDEQLREAIRTRPFYYSGRIDSLISVCKHIGSAGSCRIRCIKILNGGLMSFLRANRRRGRGLRAAATGAAAVSLLAGAALLTGPAAPMASASVATPCGSAGVYSAAGTAGTCTYTGAGTEDTFAVPFGVTSLHVTAIGAPGGSGAAIADPGLGGKGAIVTNPALAVQPAATLYVDVGAPGSNSSNNESLCPSNAPGGLRDGGAGGAGCGNDFGGGGGGGSSDLSKEPPTGPGKVTPTGNAQDPRLVVAGGGGGGGGQSALNGGNGGNAGGSPAGPGAGACGGGVNQNGGMGGTGGIGGTQGGSGATCGDGNGSSGSASAGGAGAAVNNTSGGGGGGGGGGWFGGGGGSAGVDGNGGGGGGGAGSSYLGLEVSGDRTSSTITTATSQAPSVTVTWSLISLVFSGRISADINGSILAGGLKITSSRGVVLSVVGKLVIQTANGDTFRVGVGILWFLGRYLGQISVSGPGIHTTGVLSISNLDVSDGLVTGEGRGFTGFSPYTLSFTL
jgi:hypothetical protein